MKMKLAQTVLLSYYRAKLRSLGWVSHEKAAEQTFRLFCTPFSNSKKLKPPAIFNKSTSLQLSVGGNTLQGYVWKSSIHGGKKILIVHGFGSRAYKFHQYISPLLAKGFEVIVFDAPAHGSSGGNQINVLIYQEALLQIEQCAGPFEGIVTHSLGGLAASLFAETSSATKKLILIAPVTETATSLAHYYKMLRLHPSTRSALERLIQQKAQQPISYFSTARAVAQLQIPVLWIHDREDTICPFADTLPLQQKQPGHVKFFVTTGLGHNKIYHDSHVIQASIDFLAGTASTTTQY